MNDSADGRRIFWTAWLVYAAFWNPWLQSSMTWNMLDAAVSLVDGGQWELLHADLYAHMDTVTLQGRAVSALPPGMAVLIVPFYLAWRTIWGLATTPGDFEAFYRVLVLVVGATASALVSVHVAWVAGWLGADRRSQLLAAALVAFGTAGFFFGTAFLKDGLAALACIMAFRLTVQAGDLRRTAGAGALAGAAVTFTLQAGLLGPLLLALSGWRGGWKKAAAFLAGHAPFLAALAVYNTRVFGHLGRTGYYYASVTPHSGFVWPKPGVLLDLLAGPHGGMVLYAPFLLLVPAGLAIAWRAGRQAEAAVAALFLLGLWFIAGAHLSEYGDQAKVASTLGHRMLYPAIPLFAAFAALSFERVSRRELLSLVIPSLACGYLGAQAGLIPDANPFVYALKTWVSGTGMGVLFKEALPVWLGLETLHTVVSRPDISAHDLLVLLPTDEGLRLVRNQAFFFTVNLAVLVSLFWFIKKLWLSGTGGPVFAAGCGKRAGRG